MIDHNTQETLLLDLSITLSRKYRRPLMKNAEHAEAQRTQRESERLPNLLILNDTSHRFECFERDSPLQTSSRALEQFYQIVDVPFFC
jgi:hypothetical protein